MGDPTEEKIKALVQPALSLGAEYFVIDAGWCADDGNWWNDIGLWQPSPKRFPSGFDVLLRHIRDNGLIPGVWVEPESIGIQSPMAERLPLEAFYQQNGQRIVERDRFQLDFRHPDVRSHLTQVIERLIGDYGIGYFKFDYNIEISQGTDYNSPSPGAGQLNHNRAYLGWVSSLLDKHPDLVIENCSSGAQRMDYAQMSVHPIQSTSDQEDPYLYGPIAAAVFSAVTPEQSATWAYPQPDWSLEKNAFTMVNALLGRIHLSGRIDKMAGDQLAIVKEGIELYKDVVRKEISTSVPFWPLGFPTWHDDWIAVGSLCQAANGNEHAYLAVWRRGGQSTCDVPLSGLPNSVAEGAQVGVQLLYPSSAPGTGFETSQGDNVLRLTLPTDEPCARLFKMTCASR